jgi:hypothetical protein
MASSAPFYPHTSPAAGPSHSRITPEAVLIPEAFTRAVQGLQAVRPRAEIAVEEVPAPQKLAPFAYALSASVLGPNRGGSSSMDDDPHSGDSADEVATGRLILLHDPAGHDAWRGTLRLVTYVTAELEPDMAADPLLPAVGWSWLVDALDLHGAAYVAIGGTVTTTSSNRFGDLAGPPSTADMEIRASWTPVGRLAGSTPTSEDIAAHMDAWCGFLASTAGLPPPGVTALH